jgi:hypothetical protein
MLLLLPPFGGRQLYSNNIYDDPYNQRFFLAIFRSKAIKNLFERIFGSILDEIAQLLSNSRWYRSILDESTHTWMNKCTFIYRRWLLHSSKDRFRHCLK